jgi:hypothetical protein
MDIINIGWGVVDWIDLALDGNRWMASKLLNCRHSKSTVGLPGVVSLMWRLSLFFRRKQVQLGREMKQREKLNTSREQPSFLSAVLTQFYFCFEHSSKQILFLSRQCFLFHYFILSLFPFPSFFILFRVGAPYLLPCINNTHTSNKGIGFYFHKIMAHAIWTRELSVKYSGN